MGLNDYMKLASIVPEEDPSRPDFAEKRLCMAMIRDVMTTLDVIALGRKVTKRSKIEMFQDTLAWVAGKHHESCELTFEMVCDVLGWDRGYVGPELLKRAKGVRPEIKGVLHQERGVMTRRLGPRIGKPATAIHGGLGVTLDEREIA